jgi:hypothetical protein
VPHSFQPKESIFDDGDPASLATHIFTSPDGKVLTVYHRAYDVPRKQTEAQRASFWQQGQEVEFHIGAKRAEDVQGFKAWLLRRLATNGS